MAVNISVNEASESWVALTFNSVLGGARAGGLPVPGWSGLVGRLCLRQNKKQKQTGTRWIACKQVAKSLEAKPRRKAGEEASTGPGLGESAEWGCEEVRGGRCVSDQHVWVLGFSVCGCVCALSTSKHPMSTRLIPSASVPLPTLTLRCLL